MDQVVTLSKDAPWWATLVIAIIIALSWAIQARGGLRFKKLDQEVKAQAVVVGKVHHQVANEHDTNMRDDLDKVKDTAEDAVKAAQEASAAAARVEKLVMGIMDASRQTDKRLDTVNENLGNQLGTVVRSVADLSKTLQVHINNQEKKDD